MNAPESTAAPGAASRKTSPPHAPAARSIQFAFRQDIEHCFADLNARAPMAHREIEYWGRDRTARLQLQLVQAPQASATQAAPSLRPKLGPAQAQKLHFMAQQASGLLQQGDEATPSIPIEC